MLYRHKRLSHFRRVFSSSKTQPDHPGTRAPPGLLRSFLSGKTKIIMIIFRHGTSTFCPHHGLFESFSEKLPSKVHGVHGKSARSRKQLFFLPLLFSRKLFFRENRFSLSLPLSPSPIFKRERSDQRCITVMLG